MANAEGGKGDRMNRIYGMKPAPPGSTGSVGARDSGGNTEIFPAMDIRIRQAYWKNRIPAFAKRSGRRGTVRTG
jgi:hypothetical protein